MAPYIKRALFVFTICLLFIPGLTSSSEFNPNYVISDEELQDWSSMGRGEIQAFLVNKNSFLANYIGQDINGKNKRAADIIYDASRAYKISPKYLLVMLQKEQSLVTSKNPTDRQLDYAAGYAVCDSCSFTDAKVLKYKGFGKQVDASAGIMRWYYDNVKTEAWIKQPFTTYAIDGTPVSPANYATGFLYTYTPHIEGNLNFWKLWNEWFDQTYPDGTLLKGLGDPAVYYIENGKKRAIQSMSVLISRFNTESIIEVPITELSKYDSGAPLSFPNYSLLKEGVTYYLVDFDTLRPFASKEVFQKFGYHPDEVLVVTQDDLVGYPIGSAITLEEQFPSGKILSIGTSKQLYFVKEGTYAPILDEKIAKARFPQLSITSGTPEELEGLEKIAPLTFPNAALVGDKQTGNIYVIENGKRRHITSELVFNGLGYKWTNVLWVDTFIIDTHDLGEPLYLNANSADNNTSPVAEESKPSTPNTTPPAAAPTTKQNELEFSVPAGASLPVTFPETGKMIRTPANEVTYEGKHVFTTPLDVYLVADAKGTVLAGKNIDVVRPMASFTKLMTAYRLFNEGIDQDDVSVYKASEHKAAYHAYRIAEGEGVKNDDLLKAMLVTSRNTPARMLVDSVEPDEPLFISRMNAQAKNWGLERTYFADTYGYDLRNQTTAKDYLRLFINTLEHPTIKDYLGITYFSYDEVFDLDNSPHHAGQHTNGLASKNDLSFNVISSKTGYLNESGFNLVMLAKRKSDGKELYIITMGNPEFATRNDEMLRIANWAFSTF